MSRRLLLLRPTLPPDGAVGAPIVPTEFALILLRRFVMRCSTLHRPDAVVVFATSETLDRVAPPRLGLPANRPVGLTWRAHLDGLKCPWMIVTPGGVPGRSPGGVPSVLLGGAPGEVRFPEPPPLGEPPFAYLEIEVADDDCGVIRRIARVASSTDCDTLALSAGRGEGSVATLRTVHQISHTHNPADYATLLAPPRRHTLRLPDGIALVDRHIHTQFAYCACDMDAARVAPLARAFGLADFSLSEHSDQLYFTSEALADRDMMRRGLDLVLEARANGSSAAAGSASIASRGADHSASIVAPRMDAWVRAIRDVGLLTDRLGFEVECDLQGRPILLPEDAARAPRRIGAIHNLAATLDLPRVATPSGTDSTDGTDAQDLADAAQRAGEEFVRLLERFVTSGITTLAHPFRVFRRRGLVVPEWLFAPVAELLARHGVAAEINFHAGNRPSVAFTRECLARGVRLAFGSDAHELCEIGDFAPHLEHLKEAGHAGPPEDVLLK